MCCAPLAFSLTTRAGKLRERYRHLKQIASTRNYWQLGSACRSRPDLRARPVLFCLVFVRAPFSVNKLHLRFHRATD